MKIVSSSIQEMLRRQGLRIFIPQSCGTKRKSFEILHDKDTIHEKNETTSLQEGYSTHSSDQRGAQYVEAFHF